QSLAAQSLAQRRLQVAAAEEIIGQHVADFAGWLRGARPERGEVAAAPGISEPQSLRASES
ncbi:MAG: hypothetical protein ABI992_00875, partial [Chthoniobacterales bacterium]